MNRKAKTWNYVWGRIQTSWKENYPIVEQLHVTFHYNKNPDGLTQTTCTVLQNGEPLASAYATQSRGDRLVYSTGRSYAFKRAWKLVKRKLNLNRVAIGCGRKS